MKRSRADTILAATEWIRRYFDRISKRWEIEYVVASMIASVLFCAMGALEIVRAHKTGDPFSFYWGLFLAAFGLFGIMYKSLLVRAVVRRRKAESQHDL
ncbi:MAG: hypothetical protein ABR912_04355 [Terracidiphilus sp.]